MIESQAAKLQLKDGQLAGLETQLVVKGSEMVELKLLVKLRDAQVKSLTGRATLVRLHYMEAETKLTVAKVWRLLW